MSLRRPSVIETPELKKAKIEPGSESGKEGDVTMVGAVSPGQPIFGTQEDSPDTDVEIPEADLTLSQAKEVPSHVGFPVGLKGGEPEQIDLTEQDKAFDELHGALSTNENGADLRRHPNSEFVSPLHLNSAATASTHAPLIQITLHLPCTSSHWSTLRAIRYHK